MKWFQCRLMSSPRVLSFSAIAPIPQFRYPSALGTYHAYPGRPFSKNHRWHRSSRHWWANSCS